MSAGWRPDVEALVEPGVYEGLVGGGRMQLVTLRVRCDGEHNATELLRPDEARQLAGELLAAAELAEDLDRRARRPG